MLEWNIKFIFFSRRDLKSEIAERNGIFSRRKLQNFEIIKDLKWLNKQKDKFHWLKCVLTMAKSGWQMKHVFFLEELRTRTREKDSFYKRPVLGRIVKKFLYFLIFIDSTIVLPCTCKTWWKNSATRLATRFKQLMQIKKIWGTKILEKND